MRQALRILTIGLALCLVQPWSLTAADAPVVPPADATPAVVAPAHVAVLLDDAPLKEEIKAKSSFAPTVKGVAPAVVNIFAAKITHNDENPVFNDPFFRRFFGDQMPHEQRESSLGSGVIISHDGYILTNNHVVGQNDEIKVALTDRGREYLARVIGTDPKSDIAVIKIEVEEPLPAVVIANSDLVEVGDTVFAIGNPFGVGQTVTRGIISAVGRGGLGITDYENWIQTDASINPGNSGGALVDAEGRLIGINTAILSKTGTNMGLGFAIPTNFAREIMEQIVACGRVVRGVIGITVQPITEKMVDDLQLKSTQGAIIGKVATGSAAAEAGLAIGDVILGFNGHPVKDPRQLRFLVARTVPGTATPMQVWRGGAELQVTLTVRELPNDDDEGEASGGHSDEPGAPANVRGMILAEMAPDARQELAAPEDVNGLVVIGVDPNSPAAKAGIKPKDIIMELNRKSLKSLGDLKEAMKNLQSASILAYIWSRGEKKYVTLRDSR
jgi:serine protease Do